MVFGSFRSPNVRRRFVMLEGGGAPEAIIPDGSLWLLA